MPHGPDLVGQVEQDFIPHYAHNNTSTSIWHPDRTLFLFFLGINDINVALEMKNESTSAILSRIFTSYATIIDQLYRSGARNFVFLNIPPLDRFPKPPPDLDLGPAITDWNTRLAAFSTNLSHAYVEDMNPLVFDTHAFLTAVINNTSAFPQTAGIRNTTAPCAGYYMTAEQAIAWNASVCGIPMREYLFADNLHVTYPVHEALAGEIAKAVAGEACGIKG